MKKALSLVLALILCLSLCACSDTTPSQTNNSSVEGTTPVLTDNPSTDSITPPESNTVDTSWLVSGETINVAKLREYIEIVELTTENWKEHFKVYSYSYTEEKVEKDAFGEVVSTKTITHDGRAFGTGNERYHWYDDVIIELKNKATGVLSVYEFGPDGGSDDKNVAILLEELSYEEGSNVEDFNLDDYECTRITGFIYYINLSIGSLPMDTYLYPVGVLAPGTLSVYPGTNAVLNHYLKDWLS